MNKSLAKCRLHTKTRKLALKKDSFQKNWAQSLLEESTLGEA